MFNDNLKNLFKYILLYLVVAMCGNEAIAQHFTNGLNGSVGVYRTREHKGVIRMYGISNDLANTAGVTYERHGWFDGENRLGATGDTGTAATGYATTGGRIPGTVIWARPLTGQNEIQYSMIDLNVSDNSMPMFYYNLGAANPGWKAFGTNNVAGTFKRYPNEGGPPNTFSVDIGHIFTGVFTYDGTFTQEVLSTEQANSIDTTWDNFYATLRISRPQYITTTAGPGADSVVINKKVFTGNLNVTQYAKLGISDAASISKNSAVSTANFVIDAVARPYHNIFTTLVDDNYDEWFYSRFYTSVIDGSIYINTHGGNSVENRAFVVDNNTEIYITKTGNLIDQWTTFDATGYANIDPPFWFNPGGKYIANAYITYPNGIATYTGSGINRNYPATVRYATNGSGSTAKTIMRTYGSNPYGRLVIEGDEDLRLNGSVYVAGEADDAFYFVGNGNLYTGNMIPNSDKILDWTYDIIPCPSTTLTHNVYSDDVVFINPASISKFSGYGEVVGWMTRIISIPEYQYTWNNAATKFAIGNGFPAKTPENIEDGGVPDDISFQSIPNMEVGYGVPETSNGSINEISLAKKPITGTGYINRIFEIRCVTDRYYYPAYMTDIQLGFKAGGDANEIQGTMEDPTMSVDWATVRGFEAYLGMEGEMSPLVGDLGGINYNNGLISQSIDKAKWSPVGYTTTSNSINTNIDGTGFAAMELKSGNDDGKVYLSYLRDYDDGSTLISCSQIVFGNQPMLLVSRQNGRWSNPATWGDMSGNAIGMTPTAADSVVIANVVYTGWYEGTGIMNNIFGVGGYGVNEYDLPGVQTSEGITLAKAVSILSIDSSNRRYPTTATERTKWGVALIIGNGEATANLAADLTTADPVYNPAIGSIQPSAMKYGTGVPSNNGIGIPLLFGNIYNLGAYEEYPLPTDPPITNQTENLAINNNFWGNLTNPGAGYYALTGLYITDGMHNMSDTPYNNTVTGPIINPLNVINMGDIFNNSVLDIGRQHTKNP